MTSRGAWEAVKVMSLGAEKVETARAQTLKGEFETLSMKENDQLDEFYIKLNGLVTNIRALGEKKEEAYVLKKLPRAVPLKFLHITSAIEQFGDLEEMSMEEVISSLKVHEEHLGGRTEVNRGQLLLTEEEWRRKESNEGQVLLIREEWLKRTNKEGTRANGDNRWRDGNRGGRDRSKVKCFNCQAYGHFAYECRKPRKERDTQKELNLSKLQEDKPALLVTEVTSEATNSMLLKEEIVNPKLKENIGDQKETQVWYLDNGASNHMTGYRGKFKELDENMSGCKNGEEKLLKDIYYIPALCSNIISLGQLSEDGNKVILDGDYLWVYDERGRLLMKVKKSENRLYKISLEETWPKFLITKSEETHGYGTPEWDM
ncbi:uncharacterized protein LOC141715651 [Apium graveolens]|uniref:uncharacterized protein LOC141715651 n=1 Tax=Apium graveolens TaxID=4045 RepID=UPI003D7C12FA